MRLIVTLMFIISVALVPQFANAELAKTIDELAAMYSIEKCAECHEDIHDEWKNSWHGQSLTDARVIRAWRTFIISGLDAKKMPRSTMKFVCLKCHAPQVNNATDEVSTQLADLVVVAADDPDQGKRDAAIKELSKININCVICHNMKAVPGGKAQANTVYSIRDDVDAGPHKEEMGFETVQSDYLKTAEFCAECHHGCPPGMPSSECPTLFTSYKEHYLSHGGDKTCQNCHMAKTEDEYASHKFPGVTDLEFAKEGVDVKVHAFATEYTYHLENKIVPAVIFTAQVTNTAGHGIPHG